MYILADKKNQKNKIKKIKKKKNIAQAYFILLKFPYQFVLLA